jgi:hypothetical protein
MPLYLLNDNIALTEVKDTFLDREYLFKTYMTNFLKIHLQYLLHKCPSFNAVLAATI